MAVTDHATSDGALTRRVEDLERAVAAATAEAASWRARAELAEACSGDTGAQIRSLQVRPNNQSIFK
jgi:hypothetical protein